MISDSDSDSLESLDFELDNEADNSFSESDSDLENLLENRERPKNQNFFDETIPQYNDVEFLEHFRVSREVGNYIAERFSASQYFKTQSGPYGKLSSLQHTYIFLWFAGHQTASFRDVADRFDITISCLSRVLKRLTYFLSNLAPEIIQWPDIQEQQQIEAHFRNRNGFPGIIGALDGTHIKIDKPIEDADSYYNRKKFFSIQTQLVCDHNLKIRDLFTGYPGSVHDARVFATSPLSDTLAQKCGNNHIIADSAYPLLSNLLTPFKDRGLLNRNQINYNIKLSSNRIVIEHCNGLLKQKWRQLYHIKLRNITTIVHFIRACCVLHNLAIGDNFMFNPEDVELMQPLPHNIEEDEDNQDAQAKRNHIVNIIR